MPIPAMINKVQHSEIFVRELGTCEYEPVWHAMREFTDLRDANTNDELWYLQHHAVFTQGLNGKPEHLLNQGNIPLLNVDRGGQVTYHGPGQLVVYILFDLARHKLGVKQLVHALEQTVIDLLAALDITAERKKAAPGIYVNGAKIAALGLRIRRGCSYHGLSLNIDMDLEPFSRINPCGYADMPVTQLVDLISEPTIIQTAQVQKQLHRHLLLNLGYNAV